MSDNQKYYYLRLKENFYDTDEIIMLESMPDGYLYSNILMKLYLRSLKYNGRLMFNDRIPFNPHMLAVVTRHSVGVVEKALNILSELGLIEVMNNGAIYLSDIQNFIGHSSTEADRKRDYREKIELEKKYFLLESGQMSGQMSGQVQDKCPEELDKCPDKNPPEIEIELKKELEKKIEKKKHNIDSSLVDDDYLDRIYPLTDEERSGLKEFCRTRQKIKKPLTKNCLKRLLQTLDRLAGSDTDYSAAIIWQSVNCEYAGFFPIKWWGEQRGKV